MPLLKEKCDSVFQRGKEANAISRLYVYGVLWNLCNEYCSTDSGPAFGERCRDLGRIFTTRLEKAVYDLKLITPATAEAAFALTTAVGVATCPQECCYRR